ncbi:unnamed protein product [Strongylus vulgaris]|uniref:7TM GPCR serpentine receptor class x (Srx) domain-containing protein n=1 Tax=Strongylus vulgaris TaxID=40348 RepID=A0A3P7L654_STRVU|nr:unnamed protein product [Strongylus vulgaris]
MFFTFTNCDFFFRNLSSTAETPHIAIGVYCTIFGILAIPLYGLCLSALVQRDLRAMVAYKIMIFLSICDIIMLCYNSLILGFFFIKGVVYCTYPMMIYVIGCISDACWNGACIGCFFLVFTRFVDLWSQKLHDFLFGGARAYVLIFICICYGLIFFLFPSPGLFNAKYYGLIFDPMISDGETVFSTDLSGLTAANNLLTVSFTFALYIGFFLSFLYKYNLTFGYRLSAHEKQMFIQSNAISGINLTLALIYVYMLYFPVPITMTKSTIFLWHFSTGGAIVVYLGINKTVRGKVLEILSREKITKIITVA